MAAAGEPPAKKAKVGDKISWEEIASRVEGTAVHAKLPEAGLGDFICTHHGTFHADEAMACAMLKTLPEFASMPILRTRNQEEIEKASVVVDVGGTYEPDKRRFDHHQKTFSDTYSEAYPDIKLSSAGLVYKHFGARVVEALCGPLGEGSSKALISKTYDGLIRELDALDNGVSIADEPRYRFVTHLGARVGRLNPSWQEPSTPETENARFKQAMLLAARELHDVVRGYCDGWLPARDIIERGLKERRQAHASGEIVKLQRFCPWQEHMFELEEEDAANREPLTKYVVFQDSRGGWRVQAAPVKSGSFANRLPLPKAWCGVRDAALSELTGIPGCVFVHANGFIGGNATEEGAMAMAAKALELGAAA